MMESVDAHEQRLARLEALEAIRQLKHEYAYLCDDGYSPDEIAALFVPDGVWDGGQHGRYEGREAIRAWFRRASEVYDFALHWVVNPVITIDGDTASARWYLLMAATRAADGTAVWNAAEYRDELHRVEGAWRFSEMRLTHFFTTPYDMGWARQPFVSS